MNSIIWPTHHSIYFMHTFVLSTFKKAGNISDIRLKSYFMIDTYFHKWSVPLMRAFCERKIKISMLRNQPFKSYVFLYVSVGFFKVFLLLK